MGETAAQVAAIGAKHVAFGQAYRTAWASIPKLVMVDENQVEHMTLQATNFLGINTGAIAANRGVYTDYWATAGTVMNTWEAVGAVESEPMPAAVPPPITTGATDLLSLGISLGTQLGSGLASGAMNSATSGLDALGGVSAGVSGAATGLASATGSTAGANPGSASGAAQPGASPAAKAPAGADQQMTSLLAQLPQAAGSASQSLGSSPTQGATQALSGPTQTLMGPLQSLMSTGGTGLSNGANPISGTGLSGIGGLPAAGVPGTGSGGDGKRSVARSAGLMRSAGIGGGGYAMPNGWRSTASSLGIDASWATGAGSGRAVAGGADLRPAGAGMGAPGMFAPTSSSSRGRSGNLRNSAALSWEEDPFGADEPADLPMMLATAPGERGT
jgi:hypothetical protein